jgi:predicted 3-demethylubiquinone-9 3-methyltransferase (glyoxalase superfamily)
MARIQRITACLWFDGQAEAAVNFYLPIFPGSRITAVSHYGEAGREIHGGTPGAVLTIAFELDGVAFTALNGGPQFKFNEAISLQVNCDTQQEIDHYWTRLGDGGPPQAQQCGWLKDRYGVSWQIIPTALGELLGDPDPERAARAMQAMLQMTKIDIDGLRRAAEAAA